MQVLSDETTLANGAAHPAVLAAAAQAIAAHATIRTATHDRMVRSKLNVRRRQSSVVELKALIRAQGLLQNLVGHFQAVGGVETGVIEIVAGGRRLAAIGELIGEGVFPEDYQIPWMLVTEDEAVEISLAENCGREDTHPADVFEAMLELSRRGRSIEDIGLAFHLDALAVRRRLKLANVAPRLLDLYRNDEANLEQMMALAISDDHAAQERAWDSLGKFGRTHHELRRLLTARRINIQTDRLARFVGVAAFEKAGGVVTRDLFSDSGAGYISDCALLERLALAKLEKQRVKLAKEGLGWVEVIPRADHAALSEFGRVRVVPGELGERQKAWAALLDERLEALDGRMTALEGDENQGGEGGEYARLDAERDELAAQRRAIDATRTSASHPDDKALAGAVVMIDEAGALVVKRDLIRPADKAKLVPLADAPGARSSARRAKPVHSDRLTHELTSHRTAALQAEMMERGDVALVLLTYTLMRGALPAHADATLAKIGLTKPVLAEAAKKGAAAQALDARRRQLVERLPNGKQGGWLAWLMRQPQAVVLEMLAFCVASSLDATQRREGPCPEYVELAQALELDMGKWWKPTAAGYFDHVSKERTMAVVAQAVSPGAAVPIEKMRKAAAAAAAERLLAGVAWVPEAMRAD